MKFVFVATKRNVMKDGELEFIKNNCLIFGETWLGTSPPPWSLSIFGLKGAVCVDFDDIGLN